MTTLVLDSEALSSLGDRSGERLELVKAALRSAHRNGREVVVPAVVMAELYRDHGSALRSMRRSVERVRYLYVPPTVSSQDLSEGFSSLPTLDRRTWWTPTAWQLLLNTGAESSSALMKPISSDLPPTTGPSPSFGSSVSAVWQGQGSFAVLHAATVWPAIEVAGERASWVTLGCHRR